MRFLTAQKGAIPPIVLIIGLVIIGAVAYFVTTNLNKPARIKEKSETLQPIFKDYKKATEDVIEHLEETPASDADSFERYIKKGEGILKTAEESNKTLSDQVEKLSAGDFSDYKKKLQEYLDKSAEVLQFEREELALGNGLIEPIREYEDLTTEIQGVSNYIYTDPARYASEVGTAISKEEDIMQQIREIKVEGQGKKYVEVLLSTYEAELSLLKKAKEAVETRDNDSLTEAIQDYSLAQQENTKEINRVLDEFKDKVKEQKDTLEDLADEIEEEYSNLKQEYNF